MGHATKSDEFPLFNRPDLYGPFWVCVTLVFRYREI